MKNSEKPKFPFLVDVRDYLSNKMIMKSNHDKSINTATNGLFKTLEMSENKRPFDLFAHILEG